jgi:hypothetical protein
MHEGVSYARGVAVSTEFEMLADALKDATHFLLRIAYVQSMTLAIAVGRFAARRRYPITQRALCGVSPFYGRLFEILSFAAAIPAFQSALD